jgi:DNA polymerase elongation subunit (family B)
MYRNLSYSQVKDTNGKPSGQIDLFTWDKDGNPIHEKIKHNCFVTYEVPFETGLKSIHGTNLKRKMFSTKTDRYKWLKDNADKKVFECADPETELLNCLYGDQYDSEDFAKFDLRVHFVDIEIAIEDEFPEPYDADYPINLITVYDSFDKKYHTWSLGECEVKRDDCILHKFDSESKLLKHYLKWHTENYPDVWTHWNGNAFDVPYICHRIQKVLGKAAMMRLSPVGRVTSKKDKELHTVTYSVEGLTNWDMYVLYRFKYQKKSNGKYSLGNVGEFVLKMGKIEFEGSMKELYKNNFQLFYEYNIRDVEILVKLEDKLQLLQLSRKICNMGLSPYEKIYSSIPYILNCLGLYSVRHTGKVFPKYRNHGQGGTDDGYEGAYVYPTRPGFYKHGVAVIDLNSLYPNTMIAGNMSPETKVGTFYKVSDDDYLVTLANGNSKNINGSQFNQLLKTKCICTDNNTLFFKHEVKEGVVTAFCRQMYADRKKYQTKEKKAIAAIDKMTELEGHDEAELKELKFHKDQYAFIQYTWKIFLNSIYGMYGTAFSPIYDVDIAQSITLNGQFVIKAIPEFVNKHMAEKYNVTEPQEPLFGDTDSIGMDWEIPVKQYCEKEDKDIYALSRTDIKNLCVDLDDFVDNHLNPHCANLVNERFHTTQGECIRFAREKFCMEAMFFSKKHYILHIVDNEGHKVDKFDYKGIEIAKNELSKEVKDMLKPIYERICKEKWDEARFNKQLEEIWGIYSGYSFDQLRKNTGWGTDRVATGFLKCEPRTNAHVRAAIFHNQLVDKLGLKNKYTEIKCGDDVQWCYISPQNPYGIDVMAYNEVYPEEFKSLFQIDYKFMFGKNIVKSLEPLCKIMNWIPFDPNNQSATNIFDL